MTSFSGGQIVQALNELGPTYYVHQFFATGPGDLTPTDANVASKVRDYGAYLQDSWRAAAGLTVDLGVRMDRELVFNAGGAVFRTTTWQPRVGVVWDPDQRGRTRIYAFAGRFSYALPTDLAINVFGVDSLAVVYNCDPGSLVHDSELHRANREPNTNTRRAGDPVDPGLKGIFQDELTLGVEKLFGSSLTLGLKGTYRRLGEAIEDRCDLDFSRSGEQL